MYEKEGYETTFSDALPVPPPHFDVNIPLKSLAPPEVLTASSLNNGAAVEIVFENFIRAAMVSAETVRVRADGGDLVAGIAVPTVAVIEGLAVGGGLNIATACDIRLATSDARLGSPIARTLGGCLSMRNIAALVDAVVVPKSPLPLAHALLCVFCWLEVLLELFLPCFDVGAIV